MIKNIKQISLFFIVFTKIESRRKKTAKKLTFCYTDDYQKIMQTKIKQNKK